MQAPSYAMYWREGDGPRVAGRIEVDGGAVTLEATVPPVGTRTVGFRDIRRVALERDLIRVDRRIDTTLTIGSLDSPGALRELAERLSEAAAGAWAYPSGPGSPKSDHSSGLSEAKADDRGCRRP